MVGWGGEESSSSGKKRRFEVGSSQGESSKRRAVDFDEVINDV
jgi:hypothetical protein